MSTETQMQKLLPILDEWMLTTFKIQQLESKGLNYDNSAHFQELIDLEFKLQSELTEQWMGIHQEQLLKAFNQ